jgi:hypothetical protein
LQGVIVFFGKGTSLQLVFAVFVSSLAIGAQLFLRPFQQQNNNMLQLGSLVVTWLNLFAALCLRLPATTAGGRDVLAGFALLLNFCVPIVFLPLAILVEKKFKVKAGQHARKLTSIMRKETLRHQGGGGGGDGEEDLAGWERGSEEEESAREESGMNTGSAVELQPVVEEAAGVDAAEAEAQDEYGQRARGFTRTHEL